MPSWDYYSKRRNVNLVRFIVANNIENYEQLEKVCSDRQIDPPPQKGEFQSAYALAFPPVPKQQKVQEPKKTTRTSKRTTKTTAQKKSK